MNKKLVHSVFENTVTLYPSAIAIEEETHSTTYESLNKQANALAHCLGSNLSTPSARVGLFFESSAPYVASVIGVMKSGGVFVPFDLKIPESRLQGMLEKCAPELILTGSNQYENVCELLGKLNVESVRGVIEVTREGIGRQTIFEAGLVLTIPEITAENYASPTSPDDASYIYFTSGSTGKPKPILGCHKSISHFVHWESGEFGLDETMRVSQLTPTTFDANLRDIFLPLIKGGRVCIPQTSTKEQPSKLLEWIDATQVNIIHCVPSLFKVLTRELGAAEDIKLSSLKHIMMAGEPLYGLDVNNWRSIHGTQVELVNFYGASETTMIKTFYRVPTEELSPKQILPIGQPISNTAILIIKGNKLCLPGKIGEIYIKTPFATKGYFEEPELTAGSFVQNPLSDTPDIIYKTGDLGKYREDRTIEFVGRLDSQVKVNGIRIELSEIEQSLLSHPSIREVVVRAHTNSENEVSLLSYFTADEQLESQTVREWLKSLLPDYMLPGFYVQLEAFPLNINGKIDKKSLPQPEELLYSGRELIEAETETEKQLSTIWSEILGLKRIGTNLGFFEIGGHSLKATRVISRILQQMSVHVTIREFFDHPTIKSLSEIIDGKQKVKYEEIPNVIKQSSYELSDAQRRIWLATQLKEDVTTYNQFGAVEFSGKLNVSALKEAFTFLINRHEILRTNFRMIKGNAQQIIHPEASFDWVHPVSTELENAKQGLETILDEEAKYVFDLGNDRLLRVRLIPIADEKTALILNIHHIINDAWSFNVMLKEVLTCYEAFSKDGEPELEELSIQYKDYAHWITDYLNQKETEARQFWTDQLGASFEPLQLPMDRERNPGISVEGAMIQRTYSEQFATLLNDAVKNSGKTLFTYLQALLNAQFHVYSQQSTIALGTSVSGRIHPELESQLGCFVNTIVLKNELDEKQSFAELLEQVNENTKNAFEYQTFPFDELFEMLHPEVEPGRSPFFDVMMILQNQGEIDMRLSNLTVREIPAPGVENKFDLTYFFKEEAAGLQLNLEYNASNFDASTIERFCDHFEELGVMLLGNSSLKLEEIQLSGQQKEQNVEEAWDEQIPEFDPVFRTFESTAISFPSVIAIEEETHSTTYESLNKQANALAHCLGSNLSTPSARVGLFFESSAPYVASVIGVMKSGGVFVPFDLKIPESRLQGMLEKCAPELILTGSDQYEDVCELLGKLKVESVRGVIEVTREGIGRQTIFEAGLVLTIPETMAENYASPTSPDDASYIYFTSGSTGKPKPILGCHKSISHFVHWESGEFGLDETMRVSQLTPTTFDANLRDIFLPLIKGGCVCIPQTSTKEQPSKLLEWIDATQVNIIHCVPSLFKVLTRELGAAEDIKLSSLKHIMMAGEPLYGLDVNNWRLIHGTQVELVNFYGASETTMIKTFYRVPTEELSPKQILPIGQPISNTAVLIIKGNKLCLPGKIGEIYIKTPFATKGYFEEPELTAGSFVQNPLSDTPDIIYKTGDLGKYREDRTIEFVGRLDSQVKVNGIRIELSEIEQSLLSHPSIREVVMRAHTNSENEVSLLSYFTADEQLESQTVREWLKSLLPDYMLPGFYVQLEAFPLNINGKIDKKSLPQPEELLYSGRELIEAETETEKQLSTIWSEILGLKRIGTNLGFFEIGGHSLKATRIISRIYQDLRVEMSLKDFFENSTIAKLAKLVDSRGKVTYEAIPAAPVKVSYDLSDAQRRIWVLEQMNTGMTTYNMFSSIALSGRLDYDALNQAFIQLVQRHEILRTAFVLIDGKPQQKIREESVNPLIIRDLSGEQTPENEFNRYQIEDSKHLFDLEAGYLFTARLYKLSESEHVLNLNMHHIISDGWSMNVLLDDVAYAYNSIKGINGVEQSTLNIQYKDFAEWRNEQLGNEGMIRHRQFWMDQFSEPVTPIELSPTGKRPAIKTYNGSERRLTISREKTTRLTELGSAENTSVFTVMAALINTLVNRYSGVNDVVIGTPVSGRTHPDVETNIGCFINTLPIRTKLSGTDSFRDLVKTVRDNLADAFDHQEYPFDRLVDDLDLVRDVSRAPLFDVLMVMHQDRFDAHKLEGIKLEPHPFKDPMCKFDLSFNMFDTPSGIEIDFEYSTDIFTEAHILRMQRSFELLIDAVIKNSDQSIATLPILDEVPGQHTTEVTSSKFTSITEAFQSCVANHPDRRALAFEEKNLSYKELDAYSNSIANALRNNALEGKGARVALILDRSESMIAAILGTLKAGFAYVPIEPGIPEERINFILEESGCSAILTNRDYAQNYVQFGNRCIQVEGVAHETTPVQEEVTGEDLAYVIYTSGSTGNPKGVMIEHKSVLNLVNGLQERIYSRYDESLEVALLASYSFDASVQQIFSALLLGHTLHIVPQSIKQDPEALTDYISSRKIEVMDGTPTLLAMLLESEFISAQKPDLKHLLIGGEALNGRLLTQFFAQTENEAVRISNVYGPTETCVDVTEYTIAAETELSSGVVSIGTPLSGVSLQILDDHNQPVPKGVIGEIVISGPNVSRGYINQPDRTKKAFAPISSGGGRAYRTGDFARWNEDGTIQYEGRRDQQVKIRGYRVELGEIESKLKQITDVREVVVDVKSKEGTDVLAAYLVTDREIDILEVRMELGKTLPEYMIPQYVMQLDAIPLNQSGKLDRGALPDPTTSSVDNREYLKPTTLKEQTIAEVWQETLGQEQIGLNDNFFALGGDSIKAIQIVAALKQRQLSTSIQDIFQYPTITELSWNTKEIESMEEEKSVSGEVALTPIQQWFFETIVTEEHHFNQAVLLSSDESMNPGWIRETFVHLVNHHDMLRARFIQTEDSIKQEVPDSIDAMELTEIDLTNSTDYQSELVSKATEIQGSMSLNEAPLIKLALFHTNQGDRLLIAVHHLIIDGVSWRILAEDMSRVYKALMNNEPIPPLPKTSSYQKWAEKMVEFANSDEVRDELEYWKDVESDMNSRSTKKAPGLQKEFICSLDENLTSSLLKGANEAYTTDVNILLLTAFSQPYFDNKKTDTLPIMLEGHGREETISSQDSTRTIGWFTSMYPVRMDSTDNQELGARIKSVKENIRSVPQKGLGYGALRYLSGEGKTLSGQPEILFNYLGEFSEQTAGMFKLADEGVGNSSSKNNHNGFSMNVNAQVKNNKLEIAVSYDSNQWEEYQIETLFNGMISELTALIRHCVEQEGTEMTFSDVSSSEISHSEFNSLFD